jgi:rubrerythrin
VTETLYACSVCGYIYKDKATAMKCEAYCNANKSCSLEIITHAVGKKR